MRMRMIGWIYSGRYQRFVTCCNKPGSRLSTAEIALHCMPIPAFLQSQTKISLWFRVSFKVLVVTVIQQSIIFQIILLFAKDAGFLRPASRDLCFAILVSAVSPEDFLVKR
ncbi:hypothetical protein CRM22_005855 [Opisthorchis felineus]|uniref:Uncharacterized protein n=1 Tax=Opisthorchis felineus TaxID=147828 RepID=A0A4S2LV81_OPIFE|nr:hypothetical protein CRM22_005855 [Opisthorchis felineus]